MKKETTFPWSGDLVVGVVAGAAAYVLQNVPPQGILQLYPEELRAKMAVLSSLVVIVTVTVALVWFSDKPVKKLKKWMVRACLLLLPATVVLFVTTTSFVIYVDIAGQPRYASIRGITDPTAKCNDENPRRCSSATECLEYKGSDRRGSVACWGQGQILLAEVLIYIAYLIVVFPLGVFVALLKIIRWK